jgi:hypothetical protein
MSVPVPVPIQQNINFCTEDIYKIDITAMKSHVLIADPVPTDHKSYKIITGMATGVPGPAR